MKLTEISLMNFRCFGSKVEKIIIDDLTVLVGSNSSGKTAIMSAICKVLASNPVERIIKKSDFHLSSLSQEVIQEQNLFIELKFTFNELLKNESDLKSIPIFFRNLVVAKPNEVPFIKIRLESIWVKSNNPEGSIETELFYIQGEGDNEKKFKASRKEIDSIRLIYIPAFRDIEKEIKYLSGTLMQRLLSLISWEDEKRREIEDITSKLNDSLLNYNQIRIIQESLQSNWLDFNVDERFEKSVIMFSESEIIELLKKININFSSNEIGRRIEISELGDGLKSLFYFSLVSATLDAESKLLSLGLNSDLILPTTTILLAEEPENHIAPHILGQLVSSISSISSRINGQVVMSSHSTEIIKRINPSDIRLLYNDVSKFTSKVTQIKIPKETLDNEDYKYIKDAIQKHPKLYFSKLVILVEGESEELVLPKFLEAHKIDLDRNQISIVAMDSRFVSQFWRLFNDLDLKFITLVDLDDERVIGGWSKIKYLLNELRAIGKFPDDLKLENGMWLFKDNVISEFENYQITEKDCILSWINFLQTYNVFISKPIDFDFMLLGKYKEFYLKTIKDNEGPRISKLGKIKDIEVNNPNNIEYQERIQSAMISTLKNEGGDGTSFSQDEKKLMIWYTYLFLGKSKPISHFSAFQLINNDYLFENTPEPLLNLINCINLNIRSR